MDNARVSKTIGNNRLTPITSPWMHSMMDNQAVLEELVQKYGSPINLHHIPSFYQNITAYQDLFDRLGVDGQIYFARKANKSKSLVKSALEHGIGVDTASLRELEQAVALGGTGENIVMTAAVKHESLMQFAMLHEIPVIMDNLDELHLADKMAGEMKRPCPIGIRFSGFRVGERKLYSRFGFDIEQDYDDLKSWFLNATTFPNLKLLGFHFHLDGYSVEERGEAACQTLEVIQEFRQQGHPVRFMDIGGGILMNYLESKQEWETFQYNLKNAVRGKSEPLTFDNNGLGFELDETKSRITGKLKTYPFYNEVNGADFLGQVLAHKNKHGVSVAELVRQANIQFRIEPGRSLLDQVGLTIAKVVHRKRDSKGNWLVGLEMNMSQLKSSSADFLLDPYIIYRNEPKIKEQAELYFTGAYCLEQDVLLKRNLTFPKIPSRGDFVVFVNTAGYMMHFYETEAHLFDLSKNIYVDGNPAELSLEQFKVDDKIMESSKTKKRFTDMI